MKNVTPDKEVAEQQQAVAVVAQRDPWMAEVVAGLDKPDRYDQLVSLLGSKGAVDRFKVVALHSIVHEDKLRPCSPMSIVEAIREAAVLGLEVYGPLGESWILPAGAVARLQIGYRGYLKLIRESSQVEFMDAQVVYMNDTFDVEFGTAPRIIHRPLLFGERDKQTGDLLADRGGYRGAYAWAQLRGTNHPMIEWMPLLDVEQIRKASPSVKSGRKSPWDDWYGEMMRKSPIRRLAKRLPLSEKAERALAYESVTDEIEAKVYEAPKAQLPGRAAALAAVEQRFGGNPPPELQQGAAEPGAGAGEANEPIAAPVGSEEAAGDLEQLIAATELGGEG